MVLLVTVIAFMCMHQSAFGQDNYTTVNAPVGTIRGRTRLLTLGGYDEASVNVSTFLGIPYAKPPVGELRFKSTQLPDPLEGTFDAFNMPPACPQHTKNPFPWYDTDPGQSEDCLYLNIYAPTNIRSYKRAVKFYIHGGGWFTGGSNRMGYYDGQGDTFDFDPEREQNFLQGVVVVTVNYRLGALGFLSSGTDDAPGNAGLHDIVTALRWVRDNIDAFGGDPDQISLEGQGAGAIAASLFLTLPQVTGLFRTTVLNGASLYTLKALKGTTNKYGDGYDNNIRLTAKLAKAVGCEVDINLDAVGILQVDIKEQLGDTVQCLRGVEASKLVQVLSSFSPVEQMPPNVFLPQFGHDDLVPFEDPFANLRNDSYAKKNVFFGFTSDEGSHLLTTHNPKVFGVFGQNDVGVEDRQAKSILSKFLANYTNGNDLAMKLLANSSQLSKIERRKKVAEAMGNTYFVCPIVYFANRIVKDGHLVYMLQKKTVPPYNPWAKWMGTVHFTNVQIDFQHALKSFDEPLVVNGQSYYYNMTQQSQTVYNKLFVTSFMYSENLFLTEYTAKNRLYNVLNFNEDKGFEEPPRYNLGGRDCEILKPYFVAA